MQLPRYLPGLICFLAIAAFALPAQGQLARERLLPNGNLVAPVSNPDTLEQGRNRVYGVYGTAETTIDYKDDSESSADSTVLLLGGDHATQTGAVSAAFTQVSDEIEHTAPGFLPLNEDYNTTVLEAQYAVAVSDTLLVAGRLSQVSVKDDISSGGASASAEVQYMDLRLGVRADVSDELRIAGLFSPAVSADDTFDGTTLEIREGHGTLFGIGAGYRMERVSLGVDVLSEQEDADSLSAATQEVGLSAEFLLTDTVSVTGAVSSWSADELHEDGVAIRPSGQGTVWSLDLLGSLRPERSLFAGLSVGGEDATYEDYGDPSLDADRRDSGESSSLIFLLLAEF